MAKTSRAMKRSSAMGAGGNATVTANDTAVTGWGGFATLNGTEKQVQYANDIRETMRNAIDRIDAVTNSADTNDIVTAGAEANTVARQLGLDLGGIGRNDLKSERTDAYKDFMQEPGMTSQLASRLVYTPDRTSAFELSREQSAKIKESGGTREERNKKRNEVKIGNLRKVSRALRNAANRAFQEQTDASWWIDRK